MQKNMAQHDAIQNNTTTHNTTNQINIDETPCTHAKL